MADKVNVIFEVDLHTDQKKYKKGISYNLEIEEYKRTAMFTDIRRMKKDQMSENYWQDIKERRKYYEDYHKCKSDI